MKVQALLIEYLFQHKTLSLQGLGVFTLQSYYENPFENEKGGQKLPDNAITFRADPKIKEDEGLISFISLSTGKIKPLASADLDSYLSLGKQLLNISKPFVIEGLGTLQKTVANGLEFEQASIQITPEDESHGRKSKKQITEENKGINFEENYLRPSGSTMPASRRWAMISMLIIGLGIIGWVGFYIYQNIQKNSQPLQSIEKAPELNQPQGIESGGEKTDTTHLIINPPPTDSIKLKEPATEGFNIVLEISSKQRAAKRFADLKEWGHHVIMTTSDSVSFKLAIPIHAPLADSARHRDSLSHFFGKKTWIETN